MLLISHFASEISLASSSSQFSGIKAVSAFSIPYGNDVHIPNVFGKWRLYVVLEERVLLHIGVGLMVWSPRAFLSTERWVEIRGHHFIPGRFLKEGTRR